MELFIFLEKYYWELLEKMLFLQLIFFGKVPKPVFFRLYLLGTLGDAMRQQHNLKDRDGRPGGSE